MMYIDVSTLVETVDKANHDAEHCVCLCVYLLNCKCELRVGFFFCIIKELGSHRNRCFHFPPWWQHVTDFFTVCIFVCMWNTQEVLTQGHMLLNKNNDASEGKCPDLLLISCFKSIQTLNEMFLKSSTSMILKLWDNLNGYCEKGAFPFVHFYDDSPLVY